MSDYWSTEVSSAPTVVNQSSTFGDSAKVTANISGEKHLKERVFQINSSLLSSYADGYFVQNSNAGEEKEKVSHYFDFVPGCTSWQFIGGAFNTSYTPETPDGIDYSCVYAIDVVCEYS